MTEALKDAPENVLVMGNLDPAGLFKNESAETVYAETTKLLEETAAWNNFVLSSGCDTPPSVPFQNIEAFYKALHDYNQTR